MSKKGSGICEGQEVIHILYTICEELGVMCISEEQGVGYMQRTGGQGYVRDKESGICERQGVRYI